MIKNPLTATNCAGECKDLIFDSENCGSCGNNCNNKTQYPGPTRGYCVNRKCVLEACDGTCTTVRGCNGRPSTDTVSCTCAQISADADGGTICFNKVAAGLCEDEAAFPKCTRTFASGDQGGCLDKPGTVCVLTACTGVNSTTCDTVGRCVSDAGCEATGSSGLGPTLLFERVGDKMREVGVV